MYLKNLVEAMTKVTTNEDQDAEEFRQQVRIITYFPAIKDGPKVEPTVLFKGCVEELNSLDLYGQWIVVDITRSDTEDLDVPLYNRPYVIRVV